MGQYLWSKIPIFPQQNISSAKWYISDYHVTKSLFFFSPNEFQRVGFSKSGDSVISTKVMVALYNKKWNFSKFGGINWWKHEPGICVWVLYYWFKLYTGLGLFIFSSLEWASCFSWDLHNHLNYICIKLFIRCSLLISKIQFHSWYNLLISLLLLPNPIKFLSMLLVFSPQKNQLWILKIYCMKWCASALKQNKTLLNRTKHYLVWFPQCEDSHQRQFQASTMILLIMELVRFLLLALKDFCF